MIETFNQLINAFSDYISIGLGLMLATGALISVKKIILD